MKKASICLLSLSFIVSALLIGHLLAVEEAKGPNRTEAEAKLPGGGESVTSAGLVATLADWGRQNDNPGALAVAAQVLTTVAPRRLEGAEKKVEGEAAGEAAKKRKKEVTPDTLMAEARALCAGDKDLEAAVATIAKMGVKPRGGAYQGPRRITDMVRGRTIDIWTITFRGGSLARVLVDGDGDTDLDLYVYDENGNLICSDTDLTDTCICTWCPRWTGPFRIHIKNLGRIPNVYTLITN